jgi:SpoVK/Ycf46/Vps4 family AAA+-type ATPase
MKRLKHNSKDIPSTNRKNKRAKIIYENAPPINNIKDLIEIGKSMCFYKNIDSVMLFKIVPYLEELDKMVGMVKLKETMVYQILYYLQKMHIKNNNEYLHTIIIGDPGTGKTSVARIIGKIYQGLGILSLNGPFKIAYRDNFIAEYLGQTDKKTRKLLESCIGGVLFVDELYSLGPGKYSRGDMFSKEALDTITAFLSEHKNDFCFIGAGYEEDIIDCIFNGNKGLERRFPWIHKIEKYSSIELTEILIKMVKEMNWEIGVDNKKITEIINNNKNLFKNAGGDIETFLTKCKMVHSTRVFSLDLVHKFVLTLKDFENAIELIKKNKLKEDENTSYLNMFI